MQEKDLKDFLEQHPPALARALRVLHQAGILTEDNFNTIKGHQHPKR